MEGGDMMREHPEGRRLARMGGRAVHPIEGWDGAPRRSAGRSQGRKLDSKSGRQAISPDDVKEAAL